MKQNIIFLDVDGVLNGYGWFTEKLYRIFSKLRLLKIVKRYYDLFGVRTRKIRLLRKITKATDAYVVLSSSWRKGFTKPYEENSSHQQELKRKFRRFDIKVCGITGDDPNGRREIEIRDYLRGHAQNIKNYVIIDDECFGFKTMFPNNFVQTSATPTIQGNWYENTGLKRRHVKQVIKILNKE